MLSASLRLPSSVFCRAQRAQHNNAGNLSSFRCTMRTSASNQQQQDVQGHRVPQSSVLAAENQQEEAAAFQRHQAEAPRPSIAEEARTLIANGRFGVLATLSTSTDTAGFPTGSVVEYAIDARGRPICSFSSLSPHTGDIRADGRCSLTVMSEDFKGLSDPRVNVIGRMVPISDTEVEAAKALYLQRHPSSFWVEFGDFSWFRMEEIFTARLVGGFARAGKVTGQEYEAAEVDPVAHFSAPVCSHMNADHADATSAMIQHYAGISVEKSVMLSLDRLGINVACERQGEQFKVRLPFPRPATDRKSIKELIVEMTKAAA